MSKIPTPNLDPSLEPDPNPEQSFTSSIAGIVDDARQLVTDLGLSPYRVFVVTVRWTGGAVGQGEAKVVGELELLPTPEIRETSGVRGEQRSGGLVERGTIELRKVSIRYTERELEGVFQCGRCANRDAAVQVFVEMRIDGREPEARRRRFTVTGMPYLNAKGFEWRVRLLRQDEDRGLNGQLPHPRMRPY